MKPHQLCVQKQLCNQEASLFVEAETSLCGEGFRRWARRILCLATAQVFFLTAHVALAQIDPSSALLLNGSARSNSRDNGVDSGRYTVRPRADAAKPRTNAEDSAAKARLRTIETPSINNYHDATGSNGSNQASSATGAANLAPVRNSRSTKSVESPSPFQTHPTSTETANGDGEPTPVQVVTSVASPEAASPVAVIKSAPIVKDVSSGAPLPSPTAAESNATPATKDSTKETAKDSTRETAKDSTRETAKDATRDSATSRGNEPKDADSGLAANRSEAAAQAEDDAIREQVARDQDVIRKANQNNLLDISFSAGYLYNDSSSTYSFRKYSTAAPAVIGDAHIWLSPEFGVGGSYLTTLSGSLPDGSHPSRVVPTTQQTFTLGIRYRDYFTHDLTYPYLIWGADYYQYHLSVPQDAQSRADLYSTGAKFSIMGVFPGRRSYAWNLGFGLLPKMYHHEGSNAAGFRSGGHADANSVEVLVGGRWQLSPSSSMFWRVTYQIEKDVFTGQASVPDPSSHTTPTGVSVTNSTVFLQMGYGWGN